ncbi:MAG: UDP-N-acetylmuramoyl-L-alanine--D-glutamate ligase [Patescibacteria group bacterium]
MERWDEYFKGKKITVMGLGLLGRGVGDIAFLARHGAILTVTDLKSESDLAPSLAALQAFSNITYHLGGHDLADFRHTDFVLKAAGVPLGSPFIEEARKNSIPIKMSASWFVELSGIRTVGVTGTRGKSTVTYMLYDIMTRAGMIVLLGGNIRGVSTLALLDKVTDDSVALLELDSWQLQGWGDMKMSPRVAVFTTFMKDHLNYYHHDEQAYLADKAHIFLHQKEGDSFILGEQASARVLKMFTPPVLPRECSQGETFPLRILGAHNQYNARLAACAARSLDIDEETIQSALADFKGVPGRLEFLGVVHGISVYNDSTSTTPEATLAALDAIPGNLVLIFGGADKTLSMDALIEKIHERGARVVLLAGTGTERIRSFFPNVSPHDILTSAVHEAFSRANQGESILFSPAHASFGMFKNEYDRNDQFVSLIHEKNDRNL